MTSLDEDGLKGKPFDMNGGEGLNGHGGHFVDASASSSSTSGVPASAATSTGKLVEDTTAEGEAGETAPPSKCDAERHSSGASHFAVTQPIRTSDGAVPVSAKSSGSRVVPPLPLYDSGEDPQEPFVPPELGGGHVGGEDGDGQGDEFLQLLFDSWAQHLVESPDEGPGGGSGVPEGASAPGGLPSGVPPVQTGGGGDALHRFVKADRGDHEGIPPPTGLPGDLDEVPEGPLQTVDSSTAAAAAAHAVTVHRQPQGFGLGLGRLSGLEGIGNVHPTGVGGASASASMGTFSEEWTEGVGGEGAAAAAAEARPTRGRGRGRGRGG
eukprot:Cvel_505.t1-p1 / transcript=Cvel_505.t1 / gene=Cvel_505 / organism=Chromera_velia_CCMP2878 / gene_product=hypothetical protein / transcript_product=hypothetical protein / location=Cvel_scaffold16:1-1158(-) / protein_length=323 / sequence_SO=supercontig / SO=protein_coding / is_pseudo=false